MYTIKQFADILGVSSRTIRNMNKDSRLKPAYACKNTRDKFYSDSQIYSVKPNMYIVGYIAKKNANEATIDEFENELESLKVPYKLFIDTESDGELRNNSTIKEILKVLFKGETLTILTKNEKSLNLDIQILLEILIESCFTSVQIKPISKFTTIEDVVNFGRMYDGGK